MTTQTLMTADTHDTRAVHLSAYRIAPDQMELTHTIGIEVEQVSLGETTLLAHMPGIIIRSHLGTTIYSSQNVPSISYMGLAPQEIEAIARKAAKDCRLVEDQLYLVGEPRWTIAAGELELTPHVDGPLWSERSWENIVTMVTRSTPDECSWPQNNPLIFSPGR